MALPSVQFTFLRHGEGIDGHAEEGERFEGRENAAHHEPVTRRTDVVVVVAGAEDAGEEGQPNNDVEPFFDNLAIHTGELDQQVAEQGSHNELPNALDPEMDDPPAVEGVQCLVVEINHAGKVEQGGGEQAEVEDNRGGRVAFSVPNGHADVGNEGEHIDHHEVVKRSRNLQELAALPVVEVVADDRRHTDDDEGDQLRPGEFRPHQLPVRFLRDDEVGAAHEAEQQPENEQIGVNGAGGVERDPFVQAVHADAGKAHDEAVNDLQDEQQHRGGEEPISDLLGLEFHEGIGEKDE